MGTTYTFITIFATKCPVISCVNSINWHTDTMLHSGYIESGVRFFNLGIANVISQLILGLDLMLNTHKMNTQRYEEKNLEKNFKKLTLPLSG